MQTFLPFADFGESARALDYRRLGKQRVECLQLLNALDLSQNTGWKNHPAAKMWRGYPYRLAVYGLVVCTTWIELGYKDTCYGKIQAMVETGDFDFVGTDPPWLGDEALHRSHRRNLIRKDPVFYGPRFPDDTAAAEDEGYIWPVG